VILCDDCHGAAPRGIAPYWAPWQVLCPACARLRVSLFDAKGAWPPVPWEVA
jgi:hypothetical protein